jgi:hypothetical protein
LHSKHNPRWRRQDRQQELKYRCGALLHGFRPSRQPAASVDARGASIFTSGLTLEQQRSHCSEPGLQIGELALVEVGHQRSAVQNSASHQKSSGRGCAGIHNGCLTRA